MELANPKVGHVQRLPGPHCLLSSSPEPGCQTVGVAPHWGGGGASDEYVGGTRGGVWLHSGSFLLQRAYDGVVVLAETHMEIITSLVQ